MAIIPLPFRRQVSRGVLVQRSSAKEFALFLFVTTAITFRFCSCIFAIRFGQGVTFHWLIAKKYPLDEFLLSFSNIVVEGTLSSYYCFAIFLGFGLEVPGKKDCIVEVLRRFDWGYL